MIRTLKIRVYPNLEQRNLFEKYFGYNRFCFNSFLELWNIMYENHEKPNYRKVRDKMKSIFKQLMTTEEYSWIKEYSAQIIDTSGEDVERGWKNFFNPAMLNRKPKFKSKKKQQNTFRLYRKNSGTFGLIDSRHIKLVKVAPAKTGGLKFKEKFVEDKINQGIIKTVTISKKAEKYFASIVIEYKDNKLYQNENGKKIGIDLGLNDFAVFSNGYKVSNKYLPRLKTLYTRVSVYQRILSRKKYTSNNYRKVRTKLQRTYLDIYNIQHDFLQKLTTNIIKDYQYIAIEGLNVTGMIKNRKLSKKISRSLFYTFRTLLQYKSKWHGNTLVEADTFFPSTQKCSKCGFVKTKETYGGKQTLHGDSIHHDHQTYHCYNCGAILDRDVNAAINLCNLIK